MSRFLIVFLLATAVYGRTECDVEAPLPKQNPTIDMGKFKGAWYETLKTFDPIAMGHACLVTRNITDTVNPRGFHSLQTFYYDDAPTSTSMVHALITDEGNFQQHNVDPNQQFGYEENEEGNIDPKEASEYVEEARKEYALLGDPDHYVAYVNCDSTGWIVWVYTKEKTITPELLVYVFNDLLRLGISTPFGLANCGDIVEK